MGENMKKRIITILLSFVIFVFGIFGVGLTTIQASVDEVTIKSSEGLVVSPGTSFETIISIEDAVNVVGFQFRFLYDSDKFDIISITKSDQLPSNLVYNIDNIGKIQLNYSDITNRFQGNVEWMKFTFMPKSTVTIGEHELLWIDETYLNEITTLDDEFEMNTVSLIHYVFPTVRTGVYGDVNGDNNVTVLDVGLIQLYLAGKRTFSDAQRALADVNVDGNVTVLDVGLIQLYLAGKRAYLGPNPNQTYVTLSFESEGGSNVAPITVLMNQTVTPPTAPFKDGYFFDGWYTSRTFTQLFDFSVPLTTNKIVYAKWTPENMETLTIDEVKHQIDNVYPSSTMVSFVGIVIGHDSNNYAHVADETGTIYVRSHHELLNAVGARVRITGTGIAYPGTSSYPEYTRQIQGVGITVEVFDEYPIYPQEIIDVIPEDLLVEPGSNITDSPYLGNVVRVTGTIQVGSTAYDYYLVDEDGNIIVGIHHYSSNFRNNITDPTVNHFMELDGVKVTLTGVIYRYFENDNTFSLQCIGLPSELVIHGESQSDPLVVTTNYFSKDFALSIGNTAVGANYARDLLHGYQTVVETRDGQFVWDTTTVLTDVPSVSTDIDGNKTYTFTLNTNLQFSDGTPITAHNYVFALLLHSSPEWSAIGGRSDLGYYFLGYNDYNTLETSVAVPFTGVHLINDYQFSITVNQSYLPNFYEQKMVNAYPLPIHVHAPGYGVIENEQGAMIVNISSQFALVDILFDTVSNLVFGQRYYPTVTSGPYRFLNATGDMVELVINPYYKGNYEGKIPTIPSIRIQLVPFDFDNINSIRNGEVDIIPNVISQFDIDQAIEDLLINETMYPRNGYGKMAMTMLFGPTQYHEVRQALGYLIHRQVFITNYLGNYGELIDGPFGLSQWLYQESKEQLDALLTHYVLDINEANRLLDLSPYKYESDGITLFDVSKIAEGSQYYRYNDQGELLQINHLGTVNNPITDILAAQLNANAWQAGMLFTTVSVEFNELLDHYYYGSLLDPSEQYYHLFNLAVNYPSDYMPFNSWHSSTAGSINNPIGFSDPTIDALLEQMLNLDPSQRDEFKSLFIQFADRWNELLPELPLYTNVYYDLYSTRVDGLSTSPSWSWAKDICNLTLATKPELMTVQEVKDTFDGLPFEEQLVSFVGVVVGFDAFGYAHVADETGTIYVRTHHELLTLGSQVQIIGTTLLYLGSEQFPEMVKQISATDIQIEPFYDRQIYPQEPIQVWLEDLEVVEGDNPLHSPLLGNIVTVTGFVKTGDTKYLFYLTDENGNHVAGIHHNSSNFRSDMSDPSVNHFLYLDGVEVTMTAVVYRFFTAEGIFTLQCIGLPSELIVHQDDSIETLRVGVNYINNHFYHLLGNGNIGDANVRDLIHGYQLLASNRYNEFFWDTAAVLTDLPTITNDEFGNRTYTFTLNNDLYWSNGDVITAKDYLFSILLQNSTEWYNLGGMNELGTQLVGFDNFKALSFESVLDIPFEGVRLINDYQFSLTIDGTYLPYVYAHTFVSTKPMPLATFLPGFDIVDSVDGAKITRTTSVAEVSDVLQNSLFDPATSNYTTPTVTSGPYAFFSYQSDKITLVKNTYFKGTFDGSMPSIERIIVKRLYQINSVDPILDGHVDMVTQISNPAAVDPSLLDQLNMASYHRYGGGILAMSLNYGPTQFVEVRQALAHLVDRYTFIDSFLNGFATFYDAPIGIDHWAIYNRIEELEAIWNSYEFSILEANALLDASPYRFESDGVTLYNPQFASPTYFRHDAQGNRLTLRHVASSHPFTNILSSQLTEMLWQAGIEYLIDITDFNTVLTHYLQGNSLDQEERIYNLFNLGTSLPILFDPYQSWHSSFVGTGYNPMGLSDSELDSIMEQLRSLDPSEVENYENLFVDFINRWVELIPQINLYCNQYVDVFNNRVAGYFPSSNWSWAKDICNIYLIEEPVIDYQALELQFQKQNLILGFLQQIGQWEERKETYDTYLAMINDAEDLATATQLYNDAVNALLAIDAPSSIEYIDMFRSAYLSFLPNMYQALLAYYPEGGCPITQEQIDATALSIQEATTMDALIASYFGLQFQIKLLIEENKVQNIRNEVTALYNDIFNGLSEELQIEMTDAFTMAIEGIDATNFSAIADLHFETFMDFVNQIG